MFHKFLYTLFLVVFISACSTTKDTADSSGSGSSGVFNSTTSDSATTSDSDSIEPGSQEDLIVNVGDRVFFGYDSAELDSDAKELLQAQAAWLKQYNKASITVEGHCDERGTREYNLALGERRANAAKDYLMTYGVSSDRISIVSYGKERPVDSGSSPLAWSKNRRAVTVKAN